MCQITKSITDSVQMTNQIEIFTFVLLFQSLKASCFPNIQLSDVTSLPVQNTQVQRCNTGSAY